MTFALVGNQNSGKTTLFNCLTGSNQHVGNWPGVTVERKEGFVRKSGKTVKVVDLPGIYSLSPFTTEEIISRDFITGLDADGVINIVDVTNLERNLYLTLQLMELGRPMVVALNMMDEFTAHGDSIDVSRLSHVLGVPVVPISARRGEGIEHLLHHATEVVRHRRNAPVPDICQGGALHEALHAVSCLVESRAAALHYTPRFAATKLVEGDEPMQRALELSTHEVHVVDEILEMMEHKLGTERDAAMADARYSFIAQRCRPCVHHTRRPGDPTTSDKVDRVLTHRGFAIPIFLGILMLVFFIAFGPLGTFLADGFAGLIDQGIGWVADSLALTDAAPWLQGLLVDGVLTGVGTVLGFLPVILLLFLCLSLLEDSGYMARAAFMMDKPLRKIGLSGRAFIPLMMGFGCSVPAIMAARAMENDRDRRLTITLVPFMSCGAKVPIYALFVGAFFAPHLGTWIMLAIYLLGILVAVGSSILLKRLVYTGEPPSFVMELPTYRLPTLRTVFRLLWDKAKGFLQRAFTVIFVGTVVIWFLQSFSPRFEYVVDNAQSLMAVIGGGIAFIFLPLGFGTWQAATALLTGFIAKESVVSTLTVLYVSAEGTEDALGQALQNVMDPVTAFAFLAFCLLYMPCIAAFAAMKREMGGFRYALAAVTFQTGVAWLVAFAINQVGHLF